ncbi:hypothetical protein NQZ79_g779 [Umbelopsis isabellina]|nr:hypothetical protein NQZ79_g779 [Umbelopsis isabellina]
MSCQACSGCYTGGGCSTKRSTSDRKGATKLETLITKAQTTNSNENTDHHIITTIVSIMSNDVYASQMALFQMYEALPVNKFLEIVRSCHNHELEGPHLAWLWEYTKGDAQAVYRLLVDGATEDERNQLWDHLDDHVELHQAFGGADVVTKAKR